MKVYTCDSCETGIVHKDANFCTSCGSEITNKVPIEHLEERIEVKWNKFLFGYAIFIAAGAMALISNAEKGSVTLVSLGVIGLVSGGLFLSIAGQFRVKKMTLVDSRKV
jgi:hypothetical protein